MKLAMEVAMRRLIVGLSLLALVGGCGEASGGDAGSSTTVEPQYSIVEDDAFDGVEFPSIGYPTVEDWRTFGGTPVGNEHGSIMLYRRGTMTEREDLAVMYTKSPERMGVHSLRLTGDTTNVHFDLVCPGDAVVLVPGDPFSGPFYATIEEGIRAWRPGANGMLEEFDPATTEPTGAC